MEIHSFNGFIEKLKIRLSERLPGTSAHAQMMPRPMHGSGVVSRLKEYPRQGAVMLLLYEQNGIVYFPLIKRASYKGVHSGQISLPGGKPEKGDAHLIATALRETEEEIGISPQKIQVIGQLSNIYISASHFNVQPMVGVLHHMPRFIPNQREVVDILHMPLSLISDKDYQKEMEMSFPSYGFISPYYDLNGEVVWGATAMIISEFSLILSDI